MNKSIFFASFAGLTLIIIFVVTQRSNVDYAFESLKQVYATARGEGVVQESKKVTYYRQTLTQLPLEYPWAIPVGLGPGNYSSRSAWLVSGDYLENQPSYIPVTPSKAARKYNIRLWGKRLINKKYLGGGSITNQPFSTWLSVLVEMGILGFVTFSLIFLLLFRSFIIARRTLSDNFSRDFSLGLMLSTIYVVGLFFVDNLFEWPLVMAQYFVFAGLLIRLTENALKEQKSSAPSI